MRIVLTVILAVALGGCPLDRSVKSDPDMPSDVRQIDVLAADAYQRRDWAEAERYYAELSRRVPAEEEVWFRLGNIYARLERPAEAVAAYQEALVRDPGSSKAWYNMGVLHVRQAMNAFAQMQAQIGPDDPLYAQGRRVYDGLKELVTGRE